MSLFVFLPSESSSIDHFVEHFSADVFDELATIGFETEVNIQLPKMNFTQRYQFTDVSTEISIRYGIFSYF